MSATFTDLFDGRRDVVGGENGLCIHKPEDAGDDWWRRMMEAHLRNGGAQAIGTYPLRSDGTARWGCVDVDVEDRVLTQAVYAELWDLGVKPYVEISRSKGYHVWWFYPEFIPGWIIRVLGLTACDRLNVKLECNPKQFILDHGKCREQRKLEQRESGLAGGDPGGRGHVHPGNPQGETPPGSDRSADVRSGRRGAGGGDRRGGHGGESCGDEEVLPGPLEGAVRLEGASSTRGRGAHLGDLAVDGGTQARTDASDSAELDGERSPVRQASPPKPGDGSAYEGCPYPPCVSTGNYVRNPYPGYLTDRHTHDRRVFMENGQLLSLDEFLQSVEFSHAAASRTAAIQSPLCPVEYVLGVKLPVFAGGPSRGFTGPSNASNQAAFDIAFRGAPVRKGERDNQLYTVANLMWACCLNEEEAIGRMTTIHAQQVEEAHTYALGAAIDKVRNVYRTRGRPQRRPMQVRGPIPVIV